MQQTHTYIMNDESKVFLDAQTTTLALPRSSCSNITTSCCWTFQNSSVMLSQRHW